MNFREQIQSTAADICALPEMQPLSTFLLNSCPSCVRTFCPSPFFFFPISFVFFLITLFILIGGLLALSRELRAARCSLIWLFPFDYLSVISCSSMNIVGSSSWEPSEDLHRDQVPPGLCHHTPVQGPLSRVQAFPLLREFNGHVLKGQPFLKKAIPDSSSFLFRRPCESLEIYLESLKDVVYCLESAYPFLCHNHMYMDDLTMWNRQSSAAHSHKRDSAQQTPSQRPTSEVSDTSLQICSPRSSLVA